MDTIKYIRDGLARGWSLEFLSTKTGVSQEDIIKVFNLKGYGK